MTLQQIIANGGATINKKGEAVQMASGYQVSKRDIGVCDVAEFTQQMINDILTYGLQRGEYCGIWVDNGRVYVDISVRIPTKKQALELGRQLKQITILQWSTMQLIYC